MARRKARTSEKIRHERRLNCDRKMRMYERRMALARTMLGGKCEVCGTTENLEFDHVDPMRKRYDIQAIWSYSLEKFTDEVERCQLLCVSCHHIKTADDRKNGLLKLRVRERAEAADPVPF